MRERNREAGRVGKDKEKQKIGRERDRQTERDRAR